VVTKTELSNVAGLNKAGVGFRFAIPATWQAVSLDDASFAAGARLLASANPAYGRSIAAQQTDAPVRAPLEFWAFDTEASDVGGLASTTLSASAQHVEDPLDADTVSSWRWYASQQTLDARLWTRSRVVVDGRDAVRLQMRYDLFSSTGERTTMSSVQYIVVQDREVFIIQFTGVLDRMDALTPVMDSIMATFKIF
jgi:hypothetical protein